MICVKSWPLKRWESWYDSRKRNFKDDSMSEMGKNLHFFSIPYICFITIVSPYSLWLYYISRGIDLEAVTPRFASKSIGCCKKFPGRNAITGIATLKHWLQELAKEISERLEKDEIENGRRPRQMVVSYMQSINDQDVSSSRSVSIANPAAFDEDRMAAEALEVLKKNTAKFFKVAENCNVLNNPIKFLGISVGKFENQDAKQGSTIQDMFKKNMEAKSLAASTSKENEPKPDGNDGVEMEMDDLRPAEVLRLRNDSSEGENEENEAEVKEEPKKVVKRPFFADLMKPKITPSTSTADISPTASISSKRGNSTSPSAITSSFMNTSAEGNVASYEDHPEPAAEPSVPDYKQTYAEFQRPDTFALPISMITCTQCNKPIRETEMQTHTDAHLAFQLSQEQRVQFRSQLLTNTKPSVSTPPPKRPKTSNTSSVTAKATTTTSLSIDKFLVKKDKSFESDKSFQGSEASTSLNEPSTSGTQVEEVEKCSECDKSIPISEIIEHMDYHVAKNLQEELQREDAGSHIARSDISHNNNNSTKKSKSNNVKSKKGGGAKSNVANVKSVASFFTK